MPGLVKGGPLNNGGGRGDELTGRPTDMGNLAPGIGEIPGPPLIEGCPKAPGDNGLPGR
jgi:hypothetical protein